MEELKTRTVEQVLVKTFTIQEKWLSKLKEEALILFLNNPQVYVIAEQEQIMSMVKTMVEDRRSKKFLKRDEILLKHQDVLNAKINELRAELALAKR